MEIRGGDKTATAWWTPRWWAQDARWLALASPLLIFCAHALHGAILPQTALSFALIFAVLLAGALSTPAIRRSVARLPSLRWPGIFFGLVVAAVLLSMTPFAPGGAHPVWSYVSISPAAGTLDKSQTALELIKLLGLASVFLVGVLTGTSDDRTRTSLNVVLGLGLLAAVWSVWSAASLGVDVGRQRLSGPFDNPNTTATLFGVLLALCLGALMSKATSSRRASLFERAAPLGGLALAFVACLLATASRGGTAAAAAGLVTFALLQLFAGRIHWSRALLASVGGLVAAATALAISGQLLLARVLDTTFESAGRRLIFEPHWDAFKGAPVAGYGLGTFDIVNRLILDTGNVADIWVVRAAHNVYLSWLEQTGLVGAVPMFAAIGAVLSITFRRTMQRKQLTTTLYGLLAANVVILVHGLSDFALETYSMAIFWAYLLGLQLSAAQSTRRR